MDCPPRQITCHIPEQGAQMIRDYGAYSSVCRGKAAKRAQSAKHPCFNLIDPAFALIVVNNGADCHCIGSIESYGIRECNLEGLIGLITRIMTNRYRHYSSNFCRTEV